MTTLSPLSTIQHSVQKSAQPNPDRDWLLLLACTLIILIGLSMWNISVFDGVTNAEIEDNTATTTPAFDRTSLDVVKRLFAERNAMQSLYLDGSYRFTDPSQ